MSTRTAAGAQGSDEPSRRIGILTTDDALVIASWDAALASMSGIAAADAIGRPLGEVVPDLESRGLLAIVRDTLVSGAPTVLAPAFHNYFIAAPPSTPTSRYDRMQQRVALAALTTEGNRLGVNLTAKGAKEGEGNFVASGVWAVTAP